MSCKVVTPTLIVVLALCFALASAAEFKFTGRRNAPGNDINCNQKDYQGNAVTYCKICGGVSGLADACAANAECKSFDLENGYCGYLKTAAGPGKTVYTEGFGNYCKVGAGPCTGDWNVRLRTDIIGNDLDCNAKDFKGNKVDYCKIFGDPTKVADACKANPACKAFTIINNGEGYLKTATGPTRYMESATAYSL
jgi:hypothetical protein